MITVVTCLPRSGSTLMMRMLYKGGMNVVCENKVAFEDSRAIGLPDDKDWIYECDNKAVKILHPLKYRPPMGPQYKFIFMIRDPKEMMRSQAKYLTGNRDKPTKGKPRDAKRYLFDTYEVLKSYPGSEIIKVRFEDVLANPLEQAALVAEFLKIDLDIHKMADCVMDRSPECLPDMIEFELEEEE